MDKEKLYEFLDINEGEDFQYFENFSNLVECDEDIDDDLIYEVISEIDMKTLVELCENFFDEIEDSIPEDQTDLFTLMTNIKRVIIGLAESAEEEEKSFVHLSEELNKFRIWYSSDSDVECKNLMTDEVEHVTVRDALTMSRLEKIGGDEYSYDCSKALDYPIDEYVMTFADLVEE